MAGKIRLENATGDFSGFESGDGTEDVLWKLPAADGSAGQTLTTDGSKNLSWSGVVGPGSVPLGAIIPIHDGAANASVPDAGVIDANGYQSCNGDPLGVGHGLGAGMPNVPDLTDDRFLMGTTLSGTTGTLGGNDNNDYKLIGNNLPPHIHSWSGTTPAHIHTVSDQSLDHSHSADGTLSAASGTQNRHTHTTNFAQALVAGGSNAGIIDNSSGSYYTKAEGAAASADSQHTHDIIGNTSGISVSHTHTVSNGSGVAISGDVGNNTTTNAAFDVRPLYMSVKYVMRVK
jgi:hypothetical protein